MDDDLTRIFEAHVRYELDRWQGEAAVRDTVAAAVEAGFGWLRGTSLGALVPSERAQAWARSALVDQPLADGLAEVLHSSVRAAHESLLAEAEPLSALLPRERYEQLVSSAVGLQRLRREVIGQITASTVYAELISHVLYHGLKNYLLTENAVVRRIPGASSLLRMGQNAVRSATPNLEAGIDRRLMAFVGSNVADTVRDSRRFMEDVLDDAMLHTIAEEIWTVNGPRALGEFAAVVEEESLAEVMAAGREAAASARSGPLAARLVGAAVERFYRAHQDEPVTALLTGLGITPERAADALTDLAGQLLGAAREGGQLEAYVRHRLEGFYSGYSGRSGGELLR